MSAETGLKPHDIAAAEIHCWRGRCLDLFAKAERMIDSVLELIGERDSSLTMKHLAGQRLADLAKLASDHSGIGEEQVKAATKALVTWQESTTRRAYFAHGVTTVLLDQQGYWHVQFNFTRYQGKTRERMRWTCSRDEALEFETKLARELQVLSSELGQIRKRLAV